MRSLRSPQAHRRTLRAQADVPHTFGTLLIPLSVLLLAGGGYQLERSIAHPMESDAAAILFGSVVLACGLLLGLYLLRSMHAWAPPPPTEWTAEMKMPRARPVRSSALPIVKETPPRPFHGHYVDGARISR